MIIYNERDFSLISLEIKSGIENHIKHGVENGSFLTAVLENDLLRAVRTADLVNTRILSTIVSYIVSVLPDDAYGSPEKVKKWKEARRAERK